MAVTINGTTGIVTPDIGVDGSTLVIDSANNRVGVLEDSPSNTLTVGDTVHPSYAPARAGNYIEIARTSGADAGLLINKNTGQWLVGINNGDGANAPLRFEYAAAGSSHPGLGAGTLGMIIKHDGNVGIGTANPPAKLSVWNGTAAVYNSSTGNAVWNAGTTNGHGLMKVFRSDATVFLRVDSDAKKVGIQTDSPTDTLTVYNSNSGNPTGITIRNTEASSQYSHARLRLESQNAAAYGEIWADVANAGLRLGYNSSNTVKINSSGNIVFNSGSGIDFSATSNSSGTMTSELLDDYEEGTWTPIVTNLNSNTTFNAAPQNTTGYYIKVGSKVTAWYYSSTFNVQTNGSGAAIISGFPFNSTNQTNSYAPGIMTHTNCFASDVENGYLSVNNNYFVPTTNNSTGSTTWTTGGTVYFMVSVTYWAA